jgi:Na+-translocating ferredoxin:NAD+ oxidoreductase RnfG subunit
MGPEEGLEFLQKQPNVEGLLASQRSNGKLQWFQTAGWADFDPKPRIHSSLERRKFLVGLLAIAGYLILGPRSGYAINYLTREEALQKLIPHADGFKEEVISLSPSQREEVQKLLGNRVKEIEFTFWVAQKSGTPVGYAALLDVIGKEQPITFMVGVGSEGTVLGVEVLTYRESQGSEIRSSGFMNQFVDKTLDAPLKVGRDIHSISGATLSSRSTAYAVKKALALIQVVYLRSGPRAP